MSCVMVTTPKVKKVVGKMDAILHDTMSEHDGGEAVGKHDAVRTVGVHDEGRY